MRAILDARDSLATALTKVVGEQLARLVHHEPATRAGHESEPLHQMRVAIRRLRAAMRFFEGALPARTRGVLEDELRWLGRALAPVRDLDVQLERFGADEPHAEHAATHASDDPDAQDERHAAVLAALRGWLGGQREAARSAMLEDLDGERYPRLVARLRRVAAGDERLLVRARTTAVSRRGADAIEKAHRRVLKQGRRIGAPPRARDLHELRIRAKRLRYVLEFVSDLTGRDGKRLVGDLAELQELLGEHQDACVAADVLRRFIEAAPAEEASARAAAVASLLAGEHSRATEARGRFAKAWKRFTAKRATGHLDDVLEQLRSLPAGPFPVEAH
ncbi:MAG: CHAD domain-containing protein [Deltaproteobacteria bacterium]|nr:CHAD domain-containing protein [Deltaproteobacteria bacterium]